MSSTLLASIISSQLPTTTSAAIITSSMASSTTSATASCVTMRPGKHGYIPEEACNSNYNYNPSFVAALIFTVLFFLTTSLHIFQSLRYHKVKLCWAIIMGSVWELASFAVRVVGTKFQNIEQLAFWSQILVLLAPLWVNAGIYMILGRMIYFYIPEHKVGGLKAIHMTKIFVCLDILSFLTQLAGGAMISPGSSSKILLLGIHIYMGGIGIQQLFILIFTGFAVAFHVRMRRMEREGHLESAAFTDEKSRKRWKILLFSIYVCLTLITIRIIYRLCEYASGINVGNNPIPFHEAYFYALDALMMFLATSILNFAHPGRVLIGEGSEYPKGPTRREKKAAKKMKKEEKKAAKAEAKREKEEVKQIMAEAKHGAWQEMV